MSRLQQEVQQGEKDIKTAEGQISTLKEAQDKLLEELDATRARLRETSNLLTALQVRQTKHTFKKACLTSELNVQQPVCQAEGWKNLIRLTSIQKGAHQCADHSCC